MKHKALVDERKRLEAREKELTKELKSVTARLGETREAILDIERTIQLQTR